MRIKRLFGLTATLLLLLSACAPAAQSTAPTSPPANPAPAATTAPAQATSAPAQPAAAAKPTAAPAATSAPAASQQLTTVTVATSDSGQSGYLAALIEAQGIAAKHGLKLENLPMDFTEAANALKLGKAMAATMQPSTAINLMKSGTTLRMFAPQIWSGNAWVVRKDSPYQTLKDLKGKKIGNFSRVTGAYFFSAVIAKQQGLDIETDFQQVEAETGALITLLERGEVEAINMFEPHTSRLLVSGKYRVMTDFDKELQTILGAPPLKTGVAVTKETAEKNPELVKNLRAAYMEGIDYIKSGKDTEFFKAGAKQYFGLNTPEEIEAALPRNRDNFANQWGPDFFTAQNKILQSGIDQGLLPKVDGWSDMWVN